VIADPGDGFDRYGAPEQLDSSTRPSVGTDVFRVGAIVYALLTGERALEEIELTEATDDDHQFRFAQGAKAGEMPAPSAIQSGLPPELDTALLLALRTDPNDRYRSVETFGAALQSIQTGTELPPVVANALERTMWEPPETEEGAERESTSASDETGPVFGDPIRTGLFTDSSWPGPTEKWALEVESKFYEPLALDGGTLYGTTGQNKLCAIDAVSGAERWTVTSGEGITTVPSVGDGVVFVGRKTWDRDGKTLVSVDGERGDERQVFDIDHPLYRYGPPVATGRTVFVVTTAQQLYALDRETGEESGAYRRSWERTCPPTVTSQTLLVVDTDGRLVAIDAVTGSQQWTVETEPERGEIPEPPLCSRPTTTDRTAFIGVNGGTVFAVDIKTGGTRWLFETGFGVPVPSTPTDEAVYVTSPDGNLYVLDTETGSRLWTFETNERVAAPPAVSDGTVFFKTIARLYALEAETGTARWIIDSVGRWSKPMTVSEGGRLSRRRRRRSQSAFITDTTVTDCVDGRDGLTYPFTASI